ncbi:hypothetical protein J2S92_004036 [Arthrobacter bambusae]|nr:hypothetical protein [Arthrobacter bambusae]MDQ0237632.1 hypothetical protein [Arthrobacter bambusae]
MATEPMKHIGSGVAFLSSGHQDSNAGPSSPGGCGMTGLEIHTAGPQTTPLTAKRRMN